MMACKEIAAVILAGGKGKRMGGEDKGLVVMQGRPMIEHVLARIVPQVGSVMINANRHLDVYQQYGWPVVSDVYPDYCGPLTGMLAGLQHCHSPYMLTVPCDGPFVPDDLAGRLLQALQGSDAEIAVVSVDNKVQSVFCLMRSDLFAALDAFLTSGQRKVQDWLYGRRLVIVPFDDKPQAFVNINYPHELTARF